MRWSARRALLTDYAALANGLGLVALTALLEDYDLGMTPLNSVDAVWPAALIGSLMLWVGLVRLYKRSPAVRASLRG